MDKVSIVDHERSMGDVCNLSCQCPIHFQLISCTTYCCVPQSQGIVEPHDHIIFKNSQTIGYAGVGTL